MSVSLSSTCAVRELIVLTLRIAMSAHVTWDTVEMGSPAMVSYMHQYMKMDTACNLVVVH